VQRDVAIAARSGWTPVEIAEHYGEDLHPYDRAVLMRGLSLWIEAGREPFEGRAERSEEPVTPRACRRAGCTSGSPRRSPRRRSGGS
jgi:hypothetical protein